MTIYKVTNKTYQKRLEEAIKYQKNQPDQAVKNQKFYQKMGKFLII